MAHKPLYFVKLNVHKAASAFFRSEDRLAWAISFFETLDDGAGENEFALSLLHESKSFRESKAKHGKDAAEKRWNKDGSPMGNDRSPMGHDGCECDTYAEGLFEDGSRCTIQEAEQEAEAKPITKRSAKKKTKEPNIPFEDFLKEYPRRDCQVRSALKRWQKMTDEQRAASFNGIEAYKNKVAGKEMKYIYGPHSYLETFGMVKEDAEPSKQESYDAQFEL